MTMTIPFVLATALLMTMTAVSGASLSASTLRALEDNGYEYMEDLSAYQMQFGKCVRVKVPEDDDEEGNSYFYNGHYYAQGMQFASVFLCDASSQPDENSEDICGACDHSKEYVTDLGTYLYTALQYGSSMCYSCNAVCGGRRRLDDGGDNQVAYMNVDCNTCTSTCQNMNFDYVNGDNQDDQNQNQNYDETQYLECQEAFQDENGIQIYAGPQCNSEGDIAIGFYYDDECTVKSTSSTMDFGFEYGTFKGVQNTCLSCNPYGNGEDDVCQELYQEATHCSNGKDLSGADQELPICKSYQKAHKTRIYGKRKKSLHILEIAIAVILVGGLCWAFLTLSWTYYLRHRERKASAKVPLSAEDHISEPEVMITQNQVS